MSLCVRSSQYPVLAGGGDLEEYTADYTREPYASTAEAPLIRISSGQSNRGGLLSQKSYVLMICSIMITT